MTECTVARSCRGWMLRQEMNEDRRLIDGMMKRAVDLMVTSEALLLPSIRVFIERNFQNV